MSEIILDTETTGLSPEKGDRIIEIACIETQELIPTKRTFYKLINPEREVSEDAFKIHGYNYEKLKNQKKFKEISDELLKFIKNKKLIIHNAPFDISFLNYELKKIGKPTIDKKNVIDTLEIARGKFPGTSNSLDNLCKRFGIDISKRKKHNALLDCQLLRDVYINLIDQREPTLSLNSEIINKVKHQPTQSKDNFKFVLKPTQEEIEKHKKFIKEEMKKNYF